MRIYVCFDDTDNLEAPRGTGKLVRWYEGELPEGCRMWGVVRQQLLVHPDIPYTSHNSSACAVVDAPDASFLEVLIERAIAHLANHAIEGSDPGLCAVLADDAAIPQLMEFGRRAAVEVVTQADAFSAALGVHLSGHGGTNDGVIGAAAGVGLTAGGWSGRFVEYGGLRDIPDVTTVHDLQEAGMRVLPVDRNVVAPSAADTVQTAGWLRPLLWGGGPCVPVTLLGPGQWFALGKTNPPRVSQTEGDA